MSEASLEGHSIDIPGKIIQLGERLARAGRVPGALFPADAAGTTSSAADRSSCQVMDVAKLSLGASQELWQFDLVFDSGSDDFRVPLILRRASAWNESGGDAQVSMDKEAATIRVVRDYGGIPVPAVHHVLGPEDGLGQGYVMERVAGETTPRRILRDERFAEVRPKLARQCGRILARLHQVPLGTLPSLREASPVTEWQLLWDQYIKHGRLRPVYELAFRWLEAHRPEVGAKTLVHGDFRNGNLMIGPRGVEAVLDWELIHFGDPMEDLGVFCVNSWRFGNIDLPAGGLGSREELFAGYEAESGVAVDPERVRYWEVLKTLMWGIICDANADAFMAGRGRELERAAIGRRASEVEIDLLQLLAPKF